MQNETLDTLPTSLRVAVVNDFNVFNRQAYNRFSHTYEKLTAQGNRKDRRLQKQLLGQFVDKLHGSKVLDVGCGVGYNLNILDELAVDVSGVDQSAQMLHYAKRRCPDIEVHQANFLEFDPEERYDGIVMEAFIHLFPEEFVGEVFGRVKNIMKSDGIATLTTTRSDHSYEGLFAKQEDPSGKRYRRFWQPKDLVKVTKEAGFRVIGEQYYRNFGKQWVRLTIENDEGISIH